MLRFNFNDSLKNKDLYLNSFILENRLMLLFLNKPCFFKELDKIVNFIKTRSGFNVWKIKI